MTKPKSKSTSKTNAEKRVTPLAVASVLLLALAVGFWWQYRATTAGDGPIILISIDTLRADRLPAYGYQRIATPNIDSLVADGVLFERAYSHSPQTLPSHTSILSGQLPFEHGVRDNIGFTVKEDQKFLQHRLKDAGYATAGFVSAYVLRRQVGFNRGFDTFDDQLPAASPDVPLGQLQRPGEATVLNAIGWLGRQTSPKFFLFVHTYEPHTPYAPPAKFSAASPYDGEIEYADENLGKLLGFLRSKDLYDSATIVLLSDHGEGLGDHGEDEHGIFLYNETIRVPLVVKLPGARRAGTRVAAPVQHIDLLPTILELAGLEIPAGTRGRSLKATLDGTGKPASTGIYAEALSPRYHFGWSELYALTDERYRYIRAPRDELYDAASDTAERTSIAAEQPQVREAMRRGLDALIANAAITAPSAVSAEDRQKLAALGYVGTQTGGPLAKPGDTLPDPKDKLSVLQRYRRAVDLAGRGNASEASALFRDLLQADPEMTDVWLQLGELSARQGRTADAVAAYKEVIKRNPKDAASLTGAATGLFRLGQLDAAKAHAELAADVAPAAAHELLARIALERKDEGTARREAQLAKDADQTLPMPAFIEGLIRYRAGQYSEAIPYFQEARKALTGRTVQVPDVHFYLGDCLARLEHYGEAETMFVAEVRMFPSNVRAHAGLAMLYRATGRTRESEAAIETLLRNAPTPEGYDMAAQLWTMFGEPGRAGAARTQASRLR
jgi:arylsulfatase A-like enzyme/tetratricopeptide (TPR) repeat protein